MWGLPQAIITVSLMAALLPRIARSAHEGDSGAVRDDISQGLRTTAVAIVPIAFGFVALGIPMCTLIFGSSGTSEATNMGFMLMAFGLGLIPYSVQYVVLRAFYAYEDTRTFYNTVIVAAVNAVASAACYFVLPARWAVVGMAASYGLAYAIGVGVAWSRLRKRLGGDLDGNRVLRTYARLGIASVPAALLSGAACYGIGHTLGQGVGGSWQPFSRVASPCSASSTSPRGRCASKNSTQWSEWSAGAWGAEAGVRAQPSSVAVCRA